MNKKYLIIFFTLTIILFCKKPIHNSTISKDKEESKNEYSEYKKNIASKLIIRDKPDLSGKQIGYLNKCDLVKFISEEENIIKIDDLEFPFYKIQTLDGITGYAYGGYLWDTSLTPESDFYKLKYVLNKSPFNILGKWKQYPEDEKQLNYYYIFTKDTATLDYNFPPEEETDFTPSQDPHEYAKGPYTYDGCCEINVPLISGKILKFNVVKFKGETTLMANCFIFDSKLKEELSDLK
jgi:hypothetical protein